MCAGVSRYIKFRPLGLVYTNAYVRYVVCTLKYDGPVKQNQRQPQQKPTTTQHPHLNPQRAGRIPLHTSGGSAPIC